MIYGLIGISGVGKTFLTHYYLNCCKTEDRQLLAVTTRSPRKGEKHNKDKIFVSKEMFFKQRNMLECKRKMYGSLYAFRKKDLQSDNNLIVELYYKDFVYLKFKGYPVIGIYVWTRDNNKRRRILKERYSNSYTYLKRELNDYYINILHKIMKSLGLFDYEIINSYDERAPLCLLNYINRRNNATC